MHFVTRIFLRFFFVFFCLFNISARISCDRVGNHAEEASLQQDGGVVPLLLLLLRLLACSSCVSLASLAAVNCSVSSRVIPLGWSKSIYSLFPWKLRFVCGQPRAEVCLPIASRTVKTPVVLDRVPLDALLFARSAKTPEPSVFFAANCSESSRVIPLGWSKSIYSLFPWNLRCVCGQPRALVCLPVASRTVYRTK